MPKSNYPNKLDTSISPRGGSGFSFGIAFGIITSSKIIFCFSLLRFVLFYSMVSYTYDDCILL